MSHWVKKSLIHLEEPNSFQELLDDTKEAFETTEALLQSADEIEQLYHCVATKEPLVDSKPV